MLHTLDGIHGYTCCPGMLHLSLSLSLSLSLRVSLCLLSHIIGWGLDISRRNIRSATEILMCSSSVFHRLLGWRHHITKKLQSNCGSPSSRPRWPPRRQPAPTPPLTPNAATVDSASSTSESMPRRCRCCHHAGPTRWTPPWRLDMGRRWAGQKRPVRGTGVTEARAAASCRVGRAPP